VVSGGIFDAPAAQAKLDTLNKEMSETGFWDDRERAEAVGRQRGELEAILESARHLDELVEEAATLEELDGEGEAVEEELTGLLERWNALLNRLELERMLSGENDAEDALLAIHSGAGGTESQDWASMLYRMYVRWAERSGCKVELIDYQDGDEAGIKSVTLLIRGRHSYGYLRAENGVHRLVRISPFDAAARRHTSFASVYAYPDIDDKIQIEIDEKDLRIDTYRASGRGGQHVNVTDSAVRITHLPTNIVVQCQNERSQHRNKDMAMKYLRARLYQRERQMQDDKRAEVEGEKRTSSFGSQIRSYVLHPYRMVKDHRTKVETGKVDDVLDGDLDGFIRAYLLADGSGKACPEA
jgi:peptide chain release factor 2